MTTQTKPSTCDSPSEPAEETCDDHEVQATATMDPSNNSKQGNGCLCPTYHQESIDSQWKEIRDDANLWEPPCGHAIDYLRSETRTRLADRSAQTYSSALKLFVKFLHDRGMNVCEATIEDIRAYINKRLRENRAEQTVRTDRTVITNLYKHISLYRQATPNLSPEYIREEIDPSSWRATGRFERKPLSKDEIRQLLNAAETPRAILIILMALELGARNQSLRSLKVSDVDLVGKSIQLPNKKSGGEYTLPLSGRLAIHLRRWIEVERPGLGVGENNPYLLPSPQGGKLSGQVLTRVVQRVAEKAGIQEVIAQIPLTENQENSLGGNEVRNVYRVDVHTLRHTFNHLLADAGVPREARSAALDHSSTEITKEHYDHLDDEHKDLIEDLFSGVSDFTSMDRNSNAND